MVTNCIANIDCRCCACRSCPTTTSSRAWACKASGSWRTSSSPAASTGAWCPASWTPSASASGRSPQWPGTSAARTWGLCWQASKAGELVFSCVLSLFLACQSGFGAIRMKASSHSRSGGCACKASSWRADLWQAPPPAAAPGHSLRWPRASGGRTRDPRWPPRLVRMPQPARTVLSQHPRPELGWTSLGVEIQGCWSEGWVLASRGHLAGGCESLAGWLASPAYCASLGLGWPDSGPWSWAASSRLEHTRLLEWCRSKGGWNPSSSASGRDPRQPMTSGGKTEDLCWPAPLLCQPVFSKALNLDPQGLTQCQHLCLPSRGGWLNTWWQPAPRQASLGALSWIKLADI